MIPTVSIYWHIGQYIPICWLHFVGYISRVVGYSPLLVISKACRVITRHRCGNPRDLSASRLRNEDELQALAEQVQLQPLGGTVVVLWDPADHREITAV